MIIPTILWANRGSLRAGATARTLTSSKHSTSALLNLKKYFCISSSHLTGKVGEGEWGGGGGERWGGGGEEREREERHADTERWEGGEGGRGGREIHKCSSNVN